MMFLSPIFLWLLPLVSLPVIIHLLAKRRSKLIEFPSLKFLKLLEQDALRKFNVKQLILLIIRTLIILLIILAFARPNLNLKSGFNLHTTTVDLMLIAMDNTASNRVHFEELSAPWLTGVGRKLQEKGYRVAYLGITDFILQETAGSINPGYANLYNGDIEARLAEQIDLKKYRNRSIIWLGDGQDLDRVQEALPDWDKYLLIDRVSEDRGISLVDLPERGLRKGEEYQLQVGVDRSVGDQELAGLELIINESRQNQAVFETDVNFIELSARVVDPGFQEGRLELGQDTHTYNDIRHYVVPAAGNIPVQILREGGVPDYWRIVETALSETELNLDIRLLSFSEIDNLNLSQGGTVIVEDAFRLVDYNWSRLISFVNAGGQLVLFGNGGTRMRELLDFKAPLETELSRAALGLYLTSEAAQDLQVDPLQAVVARDRLKVYQRFIGFGNELERTWIRYLDDQPFLGAATHGAGRTVWFNTQFRSDANNLPFLGIFPTLFLQLCQSQELADQTAQHNALIGDTLHFYPIAREGENTPFSIQRPDGIVDYQAPDSNYIIHYPNTDLPGIYRLVRGRQILQPIAVNITSHEAQAHSLIYNFDDTDIFVTEQQTDLVAEIMGKRSGIALWPLLLIALLFLWVVETYLSRIKSTWWQNV